MPGAADSLPDGGENARAPRLAVPQPVENLRLIWAGGAAALTSIRARFRLGCGWRWGFSLGRR